MLAALVPEVESFKQLTATKLAALNHDTIRSPIPGQEARTVLQKCRKWAGQVALPGSLEHSDLLESQLMSPQPGFTPRPPRGTTMAKAFEQLLGLALASQYPDHPEFDGEIRPTDLGRVFTELCRAIHAPHGRIDVDGPLRPLMRQIAQPLKLGEMHESHFIFKEDWPRQLSRELGSVGGEVTVRALPQPIDGRINT